MHLSKAPTLLALILALLTGALPWRECGGHGDEGGGGWMLGFAECRSAHSADADRGHGEPNSGGCCGSHESTEGEAPSGEDNCCCTSDVTATTGSTFQVVALDAPVFSGFVVLLPDPLAVGLSDEAPATSVERPRDQGASSVVLLC
jgi:hypothetical protein